MKKLIFASILLVSMLTGCATSPVLIEKYSEEAKQNQLVVREQPYFDLVLEHPYSREPQVRKIYIAELKLDQVKILKTYEADRGITPEWRLTEKDKAKLQQYYRNAMQLELVEENGFELIDTPEQADLVLHGEIIEVAPSAPKDDFRSRDPGARYYTEGFGEVTITFDVYQGKQLVLKVEDEKQAGSLWERNHRPTNIKNIKVLFMRWASDLVDLL